MKLFYFYSLENKQDLQRYGDIILDFGYFKVAEAQEHKIENNEVGIWGKTKLSTKGFEFFRKV